MSARARRPQQLVLSPRVNGSPGADETPRAEPARTLSQPLLRPDEAAQLLNVRPSWIYEAVRSGQMPCLRIGRHIRFTHELLESWLETRLSA